MISRSRPGAPRLPGESSQVLPLLQKRGNSLAQSVGATTFILGVARPRCGLGLTRSPPGLRVPGQELTPRNARGGCDGHGHPLEPNPRTPGTIEGRCWGQGQSGISELSLPAPSPAGGKEGAFYFSRQEPSRAFADARLEEGMLILFRTLRQPVFPSMPEIPWAFHSRALARCPRGAAGFGANSRTIRRAGIVGGIGGGLVGVAALSTRTGYGCPERVHLQ